MPFAIGNLIAGCHGTNPANVETKPTAPNEQRASALDPALAGLRAAEDCPVGSGADSGRDREVAIRHVEDLPVGDFHKRRSVERQLCTSTCWLLCVLRADSDESSFAIFS